MSQWKLFKNQDDCSCSIGKPDISSDSFTELRKVDTEQGITLETPELAEAEVFGISSELWKDHVKHSSSTVF